ncbi:Protein phosphatase 1 regulatory subunit 12A isoform X7 [Aphelenchoides bicaudatus]|nr:Protein phosphatase 1 regulatory subunit 12A isoform X7 [Aphelenchoides bicaudatus]
MRLILLCLFVNVVLGESTNTTLDSINQALREFNQESFDQLLSKLNGTEWRSENKETLLHLAAKSGFFESAKALIAKDPSLVNVADKDYETPLHYSSQHGHCDIVKLLLSNGANPNALSKFLSYDNSTTIPSVSALHWASRKGHVECVRTLLDKGANINHQTREGQTALQIACYNDKYEVVKLLIEKGADVNIKDTDNKTALHIAAKYGNYEIVKLLVESGADTNIKDTDGKTPLDLAKDKEIIDYLKEKTS